MTKTFDVNATPQDTSRRQFIRKSLAATSAVGAAAIAFPANVHAAGDDILRVGLIGCGGRGTGAARQALEADNRVKLVAMGDMFDERLQFEITDGHQGGCG